MDFNDFATDIDAEENGRWFDLGSDSSIQLRSFDSKKSRDVRKSLMLPYTAKVRAGKELSDEEQEDVTIKQMAKAIIVDWKGFKENGKSIPFNAVNAENYLRKYKKFRNLVAQLVIEDDSFKAELKEDAEKN